MTNCYIYGRGSTLERVSKMISVALCTYNGASFIRDQLESIMNQTLKPDEIVICDDCSRDDTVKIIKETFALYDGKWELVCNPENLGYKRNFEKAICLCHGDIIYLSDQDDVWHPKKIELMQNIFLNHPDVQMVFHDAEIVDEKLNILKSSFWEVLRFRYQDFIEGDYSRLLDSNVVQGAACAFREEIYQISQPFPKHAIHDQWLALNSICIGKIYPLPKALLKYRQTGKNEIGCKKQDHGMKKILKWSSSMKALLEVNFKELLYKESIWQELVCRYNAETFIGNVSNNRYLSFLKIRLQSIINQSFHRLPSFYTYLRIYGYWHVACKHFLKDFLCICFLNNGKEIYKNNKYI